ncbi:MAG: hypothetical protein V4749_00805 [Pseudomonadota bacterium]
MFKRWFKRKAPTDESPAFDPDNQRPKAGEIRAQGSDETLFLAPLPVYTGQMPIGSRSFSQMNDVYLELGGSNRGTVETGKMLAFMIWLLILLIFGVPLLLGVYLALFGNEGIEQNTLTMMFVFQAGLLYGIPGGGIALGAFLYGIVADVHKQAKTYPLRFNRQRREVCYVDSSTHRVLIAPWESVVAWVSNNQAVTPYGVTRQYCFGMGLDDEEQDRVQFVLIPQFSDAHALGLWTAIRNYMENEPLVDAHDSWLTALGVVLTEDELKPYEGLHNFEIERLNARFMGDMDLVGGEDLSPEDREKYGFADQTPWPLRWWYVRRVLTFWKMPYQLAEWSHRKGRPTFPEQVQLWSQPLPSEQWATPSLALQKANQQVRDAMDKQGATFAAACKGAGLH